MNKNNNKKKLGHWCCVPGCKFDKQSSLHRFPKNPALKKKWVISCRIGKTVTSNMCVCSAHFRREDYMPRLSSKKPRLRRNEPIIPTLNLPKRPLDKILTGAQEKQIADRENRFKNRQIAKDKREALQKKFCLKNKNSDQIDMESENNDVQDETYSIQNVENDLFIGQDVSGLSCDVTNEIHCSTPKPGEDLCISQNISSFLEEEDAERNHKYEKQDEKLYTYSEVLAASILLELQEKSNDIKDNNFIKINEEIHVHMNSKGRLFNLMKLLKSDDDLKIFTGIHFQLLNNLSNAVKSCEKKKNPGLLSVEERIVLCLCKLKLNLSFKCLAVLFSISRNSCSHCFLVTLHTLAFILDKAIYWPSKEQILKSMPKCFERFKDTYIVLDCTEIPVEKPKCLKCRLRLYSHYKGCETVKLLIGISPSGLIIFLSECFGGRASDKAIFNQSNILDKLEPTRDAIMVDKGFAIEEECAFKRIKLYIPPKLSKNKQLSVGDVTSTVAIASARVHVERVIQRMKQYEILKSKISLKIAPYMNEICKVICGLVNVNSSILADSRFIK